MNVKEKPMVNINEEEPMINNSHLTTATSRQWHTIIRTRCGVLGFVLA